MFQKSIRVSVRKLPTVSAINEERCSNFHVRKQNFSILQIIVMVVLMINADLIYL